MPRLAIVCGGILATALIVSSAVVYAGHTPDATGIAQAYPVDASGIQATIMFTDDGTDLTVNGTATGLDPGKRYVSLIYDVGSFPGGPDACLPTIFDSTDPNFILPTMCVGEWAVTPGGTGMLMAINTNDGQDYVPLAKIGTISVREFTGITPCGPPEEHSVLVACGKVAVHPGQ